MNNSELQLKQKQEALLRMKILKLHGNVIREFKGGQLNLSEHPGFLFWLNDEELKIVKEFEEENDCMVYHVIKTNTDFGLCYSLLFVSHSDEGWEEDRTDLQNQNPYVYVHNADAPLNSEFGYIGVVPNIGGVARTE